MVKGPSPDDIQEHFWQGPAEIPDDEPEEPEQCSIQDEDDDEDDNPDDPGEPDEPGADPPTLPPVEPVLPPAAPFIPFPFPWAPLTLGNHTFTLVEQTPTKTTKTLIAPTTRPRPSTTVPFETPIRATPVETPDFPNDPKPSCYNKGPSWDRKWMVKAVDSACNQITDLLSQKKSTDIGPGLLDPGKQPVVDLVDWLAKQVDVGYTATIEVKEGCVWKKYSFNDCASQFRRIVDECDTKGVGNKHGGVLDGKCVKWRLDMYWEAKDKSK